MKKSCAWQTKLIFPSQVLPILQNAFNASLVHLPRVVELHPVSYAPKIHFRIVGPPLAYYANLISIQVTYFV